MKHDDSIANAQTKQELAEVEGATPVFNDLEIDTEITSATAIPDDIADIWCICDWKRGTFKFTFSTIDGIFILIGETDKIKGKINYTERTYHYNNGSVSLCELSLDNTFRIPLDLARKLWDDLIKCNWRPMK